MAHDLTIVILATGKAVRMKSTRNEVLHHVCGWPILRYVLAATQGVVAKEILVVIGDSAGDVQAELNGEGVGFVQQCEPRGTGHAVLQTRGRASGETLMIVPGNVPLLTTAVLQDLLTQHLEVRADLSVLTVNLVAPGAYGRLVRDRRGEPIKIVEVRDATEEELDITEANTGVYCIRNDAFLWESLAAIDAASDQREIYLTDLVKRYRGGGRRVGAVKVANAQCVMRVDSRGELLIAEGLMRRRIADDHMAAGVTIADPERTHIDFGVTIGMDTEVLPGTYLRQDTSIGEHCTIGPDTWIESSTVEDNCRIWYSAVEGARVRTGSTVGPFAHLRPGADVGPNTRIGNFVEVKASRIRRGAKAGHLAYLGDADIGEDVNIGAGTITCNFDGKRKHRTTIGDRAFVGSNTSLVAPLTIGDDAIIGAGSTITEDVPPGSLGLGRAQQVVRRPKQAPQAPKEVEEEQ
ncbi:MAG TPA: bifunctional UDP-N-acetylglucosamine diphosphorylase/glucosamine-1-phosphate N-acetyltransferase GlmU [Candidatus Heimdallarchaeota archaeon]|nr:bifunctional UDP-N-acetylglucosamine diphosphorylase/glucosamine-1-phosphate N-acetyltransferase GlmU [Candidatus Heimdallarchaeota archaeon]